MKFFEEKEAVAFIKSKTDTAGLSDDDLLEIIDVIFDFYDENGDLELDFDDDEDEVPDIDSICSYVEASFEDNALDHDVLRRIIQAELDYEESLLND